MSADPTRTAERVPQYMDVHGWREHAEGLEAEVERLTRIRGAGLLLRADIPCSNGCGCEDYDYCAAEMWDKTLAGQENP